VLVNSWIKTAQIWAVRTLLIFCVFTSLLQALAPAAASHPTSQVEAIYMNPT
jgi:hypothetical protein